MIKKYLLLGGIAVLVFMNAGKVLAAGPNLWGDGTEQYIETKTGLAKTIDPQKMIINVVNFLLTFLGIIAVVLMLYAGWLWMTDQGGGDNIKKAKGIMLAAVVGLLIILAAFGIVNWVLANLSNVVSGT